MSRFTNLFPSPEAYKTSRLKRNTFKRDALLKRLNYLEHKNNEIQTESRATSQVIYDQANIKSQR